jgi:hypothetical protein
MSEPVVSGLGRLLDRALRRLGEVGQEKEACRLAAAAWALLEGNWPREARRFEGTLHYLTLKPRGNSAVAAGQPLPRSPDPGQGTANDRAPTGL